MDEFKIMDLMNDIKYGWIDKNGSKRYDNDNFFDDYRLESYEEVIKNKLGVCWDQVELERFYFEKKYKVKTYFIVYYDNIKCPTHTFLVFKKNKKYYWFEHAWEWYKGIHEYNSLDDLLLDVKNKFIEELEVYEEKLLKMYEYSKPKSHINVETFFDFCMQEEKLIK